MELDIVTPERRIRSIRNADVTLPTEVRSVIVPGSAGQYEVLPGHAPLLTKIATGLLTFDTGTKKISLMVSGGFCEVDRDRVTVMCEAAALAEEVDKASEEAAHLRLQQELAALGPVAAEDEGFQKKRAEVERAATKLLLK